MPRKPRFYLPDVAAHVVQRGNNRQAVFFADDDFLAYLSWLEEGAHTHGCAIHAYCLMTNHVHLLVTPDSRYGISRMIQYVGRNYVTYVNRQYRRSGTLWEGRHKGCVVDQDEYFLRCSHYIECNPVRAGMVDAPGQYPWSSYRSNAMGEPSTLLTPHPMYESLGRSHQARQQAYRAMFSQAPEPEQICELRAAVQTGTPLGNERFREEIADTLQCKVGQPRRGRPARRNKGY